jgi:hypothetical protein
VTAAATSGAAAGVQEESWAEPEFPQVEATLTKLGWHELCEHVAGFASTELGRAAAEDLWLPSTRTASEVRASLYPHAPRAHLHVVHAFSVISVV